MVRRSGRPATLRLLTDLCGSLKDSVVLGCWSLDLKWDDSRDGLGRLVGRLNRARFPSKSAVGTGGTAPAGKRGSFQPFPLSYTLSYALSCCSTSGFGLWTLEVGLGTLQQSLNPQPVQESPREVTHAPTCQTARLPRSNEVKRSQSSLRKKSDHKFACSDVVWIRNTQHAIR